MPEISVIFKKLATTAKIRSARGVVAVLIKENSLSGLYTYSRSKDIKEAFTLANLALLKMCFDNYGVNKIIVASGTTVAEQLALLENIKFNYLTAPNADTEDNETIVDFIKKHREDKFKCKAVLVNIAADDEAIINFTSEEIKKGTIAVTPQAFSLEIACALATLPLSQSATYYVFSDVTSVTTKTNSDTAIDNGELFLINDGEKIKLSRAVNSLKTITGEKKESMKKIKIVDGMDLISEDIHSVFENNYTGKVTNNYDNKTLLFDDINNYLKTLTTSDNGVLDPDGTNYVEIDVDAQKEYLEKKLEIDTSNMTDVQVLHANTGSLVFGIGQVSFVDAMEDLKLPIYY